MVPLSIAKSAVKAASLHKALNALSALALAAVMTAAHSAAPPSATAQGAFGSGDQSSKLRKAKRRAQSAENEDVRGTRSDKNKKKEEIAGRKPSGPLVVSVSLARQRLTVYDANGPIAESPISSGRVGYATPTGVFSVVQKRRQHFSNLYAGASMPNMQRITWSGVALHAGALPGYPASHGCIRLPHGFSKKLFGLTSMGTRVIVSRDPVSPVPFAHDRLFTAFPPEAVAQAGSGVKVADASAATGDGAVSSMLGVSTALAAETPSGSARSAYRERRRIEAEQLTAEIRAAGYDRAAKDIALTQAQKEAAEAFQPLNAARAEAERLESDLKDLEKAKARVDRELAALEAPEPPAEKRAKRKPKKSMDAAERAARIAELRDELKEYPAQADGARTAFAAADAKLKAAETVAAEANAKRTAAMNTLAEAHARLSRAQAKEDAAKRMEAKRALPVSVFISRAKKRLYVRQGYEDMFDIEIAFERPDEPVGTHVFTALDYTSEKTAMQWSVASIAYDPNRAAARKSKKDKTANKKGTEKVAAVSLSGQTAASALERITIPDETREQIADVMKPGSSLVISDLPIGNETGKYTDFIVPIR